MQACFEKSSSALKILSAKTCRLNFNCPSYYFLATGLLPIFDIPWRACSKIRNHETALNGSKYFLSAMSSSALMAKNGYGWIVSLRGQGMWLKFVSAILRTCWLMGRAKIHNVKNVPVHWKGKQEEQKMLSDTLMIIGIPLAHLHST